MYELWVASSEEGVSLVPQRHHGIHFRADLLAFKTFLRDKKDQSDRSIANKFENVCSFLKQQKIVVSGPNGLIGKNDWPVYTTEEVSTYTDEELDKFSEACDETEKLWFKFFYVTAMREQEVCHAEWSWIDFENNMATVRENNHSKEGIPSGRRYWNLPKY